MALRFDADFLRKLEHLHVVSKRAFAGQHRADRLAATRGRGLEFADHRPYAHGDDFRHIDWKAYKRLNRLLVRLFDEERDLPIHLLIDASRSMAEPAKFDMARRLTAALCYIGLAHLDRLTIRAFGARLGAELAPGRGKARIMRVFDFLEQLEARGATDLHQSITDFASRRAATGLIVVVSDFLDPHGAEGGLRLLRTMGHDVLAVHVTSARDRDPGVLGEVQFVDAETGERREIDVTPQLAAAYVDAWNGHAAELEQSCGRYDIGYLRANAEQPFEDVVLRTFRLGRFVA